MLWSLLMKQLRNFRGHMYNIFNNTYVNKMWRSLSRLIQQTSLSFMFLAMSLTSLKA